MGEEEGEIVREEEREREREIEREKRQTEREREREREKEREREREKKERKRKREGVAHSTYYISILLIFGTRFNLKFYLGSIFPSCRGMS